ncbi:PDP protein [Sulfurimonas sp.]|jgi:flagellar motility protein MotE (MotC chaperone)|uniref:MotE family protein n=1 Tax=Sulfurimonas sp. TaxID=2022749 RepID=UPI0025F8917B|nr:PDP protein [Sulfurimonas sp.]MBT5935272.1 PDP protein [Sulfurimonas sp.]
MKKIILLSIYTISLFALQTSDRLFECTEIFQERKSELLVELERIDEQKQALDALKIATEELLKQKGDMLSIKEEEVNIKLEKIVQKVVSIKKMLKRNEEVLRELKNIKMTKIAETFSKMKPAAASGILSKMKAEDAVKILQSLKPKVVGKILTKMDANKASELTILLNT